MEHPLAMDAEAMRRAGYATVDALVARLADPEADPVLRRADPAGLRARLGGPPPEQPGDYGAVLARVIADVLPYAARTDHPGYLAFIPSFTTWPAALAELTAAAANPYCGAWLESAGPAQVELEVIDWFRGWLGLPAGTAGVLVNGGSAANLTALLVAREAAGGPSPDSVVYVSDQAHSSLARTARAMGLRPQQVRVLPTDDRWRLAPDTVAAAVRADRAAGRVPFALCASAGSTNSAAARRSPPNWSGAAPRWSPPPGWPGGTPSGYASSTPPAVRRMCGALSNTSHRHRPRRTYRRPSVAPPIPRQACSATRAARRAPTCWKPCRCSLACRNRSSRRSATGVAA